MFSSERFLKQKICSNSVSLFSVSCPSNSSCVMQYPGSPGCVCDEGFYGYKCLRQVNIKQFFNTRYYSACILLLLLLLFFYQVVKQIVKHCVKKYRIMSVYNALSSPQSLNKCSFVRKTLSRVSCMNEKPSIN